MTHLDPKALEAARVAIRYLNHPETPWSDEQVGAVISAYLAALPQAEPVAWIERVVLRGMAAPSVAELKASVYNCKLDDSYVPLFASPTPAVSREVQQWPEHASPLPWKYVRVDHGLGQAYDRIEDASGGVVVEHVGHIDGPAIVAAANAAEPHHG
jgi:hypothetical protein